MEKTYEEYIEEIEKFAFIYNLSASDKLLLHIAASFKVNKQDYDSLKEEFILKKKDE